jgi:hypothetical protein
MQLAAGLSSITYQPMCTATFLPRSGGGFVLTHSRDEKTARPTALLPGSFLRNGHELIYPKDPQGSGTWIVASPDLTVCLLNGAFRAHVPQPPYAHSRGLVPLQVFDYPTVDDFLNQHDPYGLEPFTLLLAQTDRLTQLRWDGHRADVLEKDSRQPHIWSSVTLYSPEVVKQRQGWFDHWLSEQPDPSVTDIRAFHQVGGQGDAANAIRMHRPGHQMEGNLMTLSLTSVLHEAGTVEMIYEDFGSNQLVRRTFNTQAHVLA